MCHCVCTRARAHEHVFECTSSSESLSPSSFICTPSLYCSDHMEDRWHVVSKSVEEVSDEVTGKSKEDENSIKLHCKCAHEKRSGPLICDSVALTSQT